MKGSRFHLCLEPSEQRKQDFLCKVLEKRSVRKCYGKSVILIWMEIFIGADHAGYELKNQIDTYLKDKGYHVVDLGIFSVETDDYPEIGREVAEKVRENEGSRGFLFCESGIGICKAANEVKDVHSESADSIEEAKIASQNSAARILCMGSGSVDFQSAKQIVDEFLG
jgi:RpiB/LacA/LacB family sugar-phosphate isomerase